MFTLALFIILLWVLGFLNDIGGALIHGLLLIALVILVVDFIRGRRQ